MLKTNSTGYSWTKHSRVTIVSPLGQDTLHRVLIQANDPEALPSLWEPSMLVGIKDLHQETPKTVTSWWSLQTNLI